jgi:hypothetical protein
MYLTETRKANTREITPNEKLIVGFRQPPALAVPSIAVIRPAGQAKHSMEPATSEY